MKKFLCILFSLAIVLTILPLQVLAEETEYVSFCGNDEIPADITEITIGTRGRYIKEKKEIERIVSSNSETVYSNLSKAPLDIKELYTKLPNLERISIANNNLKNVWYFTKFEKLNALELYECEGISDLQFAPHCKRLTEFAYTCEGLSDISEIGKMTRLKKLTIEDDTTYDYLGSDFIALREKVQAGNYLCDLTPLENLTGLTELTVEGAAVDDISPLLKMPQLTKFTLSNATETDLSPLEKLDNLKSFTFRISDERFIKSSYHYGYVKIPAMKNLEKLSLSDCYFYDEIFDGLPKLKTLKLTKCAVKNRDGNYQYGSKKLREFETLFLDDTAIADKTFTLFSTAREVTMSDCRIDNITKSRSFEDSYYDKENKYDGNNLSLNYLKTFKNLERLTVEDCFIYDISGLKNLKGLTYLSLSSNCITDITPLEKLENLKVLDISDADWHRYYSKDFLKPLKNFKSLEELNISCIFDDYEDMDMWKEGTENSVFDTVCAIPKLKKLTVSAIYGPRGLMEEFEEERSKLFKEKMPNCEVIVFHPLVLYD